MNKQLNYYITIASNLTFFKSWKENLGLKLQENWQILRTVEIVRPNRFSPEQIQLAASHLNSFARASLNNIPAISLFEQLYGKKILQKLGIKLIPPEEICLTPLLFD